MTDWTAIRFAALGEAQTDWLPRHISLPVLPRMLTEFCRRADDPDATPRQLSALIETDIGLSCELLRHANSAHIGLRHKASSAQQALAMLGIRQTKLFLLSAGMRLALAARQSRLMHIGNFWNANLERALFAREVARLLHADLDLAFAGGMLQDFLLPVLTNELLDFYVQYLDGVDQAKHGLAAFEQSGQGWTHALAGARLMCDWNFPDDLICCLLHHHRGLELLCDRELGRTAAAAVAVSSLVPDAMRQTPDGLEQLLQLEQVWPAFHLEEIATRVHEEFLAMTSGASHPFSLLHHCKRRCAVAC